MNQIPAAGKDRHSVQSLLLGIPAVDELKHCTQSAGVKVNPPMVCYKSSIKDDACVKYEKDKTTYTTITHCMNSYKLVQHLCNMLTPQG